MLFWFFTVQGWFWLYLFFYLDTSLLLFNLDLSLWTFQFWFGCFLTSKNKKRHFQEASHYKVTFSLTWKKKTPHFSGLFFKFDVSHGTLQFEIFILSFEILFFLLYNFFLVNSYVSIFDFDFSNSILKLEFWNLNF